MGREDLDILKTAHAWKAEGRSVALATVISTWGSSPQPVGSQLAVDGEGNFEGSVSGGCVEGAVITEALDIIETGDARILEYAVTNDNAFEVGLACGGAISIYVERLDGPPT
ncbi:MAG: XdhC family protein [Hyphomicrobiales bacterium]|nr:XdhC family protein [Hyphomicrobiales bacterium]